MRGLTVRKHNGVILHDVNLDVEHGEIMALIGRNGAGKPRCSALLGRIATRSVCLPTIGKPGPTPRIGYVPQTI
ncbi:MAG: ATP-binding cassette domain-containing protein [Hydrogeniiclostridium mannosilyticum]